MNTTFFRVFLIGLLLALAASGCTSVHQIRRVANVPPATGTPTSGLPLGQMNVRASFDAFPMRSFMRTQGDQELGDVGLRVQTTQLGGSIRLGLSDHVNLGIRYDSGLPGVTQASHESVAPTPRDVAHGISVEVEGSWETGEHGYIGFYANAGIWEVPYAIYEDFTGNNVFERTGADIDLKLSAHFAVIGGGRWDWFAVYGGLNIQTAFENEGFALTTTAAEVFRASTGNESTVRTVILPPTVFLGAELLAFKFITLGVQGWVTIPFANRVQAVPGIGAWLAFNSGGLRD